MASSNPIFDMMEGDPCPHDGCLGKLVLLDVFYDDYPIFYCDAVGHSFEKGDYEDEVPDKNSVGSS